LLAWWNATTVNSSHRETEVKVPLLRGPESGDLWFLQDMYEDNAEGADYPDSGIIDDPAGEDMSNDDWPD
jgi:hypothetical protein